MRPPPWVLALAVASVSLVLLVLALYAPARVRPPSAGDVLSSLLATASSVDARLAASPLIKITGGQSEHNIESTSSARRIILASVPRSGNHYVRTIFEHTTGLGTESVYSEGGHPSRTWSERTRAYYVPMLSAAHVRRAQANESVIVKTHWPFHNPTMEPTKDGRAGGDVVHVIIKQVREPFGNWLAWLRMCVVRARKQRSRNSSRAGANDLFQSIQPDELDALKPSDKTFAGFVTKWSLFHLYWRNVSASLGVPLLEFRFEDLEAPHYAEQVFMRVLAVLPFSPASKLEQTVEDAVDRVPFLSSGVDRVFEVHPALCTLFAQVVDGVNSSWGIRLNQYSPFSEFYDAQVFRTYRRTYYRSCKVGLGLKGSLPDLSRGSAAAK
ncbi:hypothetical protein FVE85_6504 [Porphyridium purpureum]|uniref:Sulfotransferase domain-containing protein n=1 Tax=Porphyridium purpureum TaxID=35688 RepID=A0A5J4Z4J7_PORPP|nr:hypothetical protein FVE85_6504 [Porphyridium purpureum]|eukprot:POR1465..scf295_1